MYVIDAKPYEYAVENLNQLALLVIDMQNDFYAPNGFGATLGNDVENIGPCVPYVKELIRLFHELERPIIFTKEAQNPNLTNCPLTKKNRGSGPYRIGDPSPMGRILIEGTEGSDIIKEVKAVMNPGDTQIYKPGKDAFWGTDLAGILFNLRVSHLIICGVTTEVCVQTTMREANDRGYVCLLAEQATDSYNPEFKSWTLKMIVSQGAIVGWTATNEAITRGLKGKEPKEGAVGGP